MFHNNNTIFCQNFTSICYFGSKTIWRSDRLKIRFSDSEPTHYKLPWCYVFFKILHSYETKSYKTTCRIFQFLTVVTPNFLSSEMSSPLSPSSWDDLFRSSFSFGVWKVGGLRIFPARDRTRKPAQNVKV